MNLLNAARYDVSIAMTFRVPV